MGISTSSTTMPVASVTARPRPILRGHASSRAAAKARKWGCSASATIAVTAAKLIWKLGPTNASGQRINTSSAPLATSRRVIASRPSAKPPSTSKAAMHDRTVGTSAPVSQV